MTLEQAKALAIALGYQVKCTETSTHVVEQVIRPDGSVAVTATKRKS